MSDTPVQVNIDDAGGTHLETVYDWDTVLVFPRQSGGERRRGGMYNCDRFVRLLLGLRTEKIGKEKVEMIDKAKAILRTDRCFLDAQQNPNQELKAIAEELATTKLEKRRAELEMDAVKVKRKFLVEEYKAFCKTDEPILQSKFCDLVVRAILKRVQDACGLECQMKESIDGDEIICCLRADDNDLKTEADRCNYKLQCHNRPFDPHRRDVSQEELRNIMGDQYDVAKALLQSTCDEDKDEPMLDPGLFRNLRDKKDDSWHPKLAKAMVRAGHAEAHQTGVHPEADGGNNKCGGGIYLAPYFDFKSELKYQIFYRHYHRVTSLDQRGWCKTPFRPIDRVRLINMLLARHLNMPVLSYSKLILAQFALHDEKVVKHLRENWVFSVKTCWDKMCLGLNQQQPLLAIRDYFGEKIGLYFAWLQFYTRMLRWPSFVGFVMYIMSLAGHDVDGVVLLLYAGYVSVWATMQTELWNRRNAFLNLWWGTSDFKQAEGERPAFHGIARRSPVNDRKEMQHTSVKAFYKRMVMAGVVSFFAIVASMLATFSCLLFKSYLVLTGGPPIYAVVANTFVISGGNAVWTIVSRKLTDWENHRTASEYEDSLITKTFLFRFCNSYMSFFFIAFVKEWYDGQCLCTVWDPVRMEGGKKVCLEHLTCMEELRQQLTGILLIQLVVGNTTELLVPALMAKLKVHMETRAIKKEQAAAASAGTDDGAVTENDDDDDNGLVADAAAGLYEQPELEAKYAQYEEKESFEDYAEMVLQYGYVTLFVVAFPLVPCLALLNNTLELHVDAHKLCYDRRKPSPHSADSIGKWYFFLNVLSKISVITNTMLICFTSSFLEHRTTAAKFIIFVTVEHAMLLAKQIVEDSVPDAEQFVLTLEERFRETASKLFLEIAEDDDDNLEEVAEAVDLTIHKNDFKFGRQVVMSQKGEALGGVVQGAKLVV